MSDLRERVAGILVDEFPAEIKRPSDAYRVVSEILALLAPREECEHEWHSNAGEDYRLCIKCGISSSPREESGLREWQGPWKCDKCGFIREGPTHRRLTYRECGNMNRCNGKMLPYDRRALAALARTPPHKPAETPARWVCKECGKLMDPAYMQAWENRTANHWDGKKWCGPVVSK